MTSIIQQPAEFEFTFLLCAKFVMTVSWFDKVGNLMDLTDYTASFAAKRDKSDSTKVIDWTTTGGELTLGGVNGTIDFSIGGDSTDDLDFVKAHYELMLYPSGSTDDGVRLMQGLVSLDKEVH